MTLQISTLKTEALQHINAALDVKFRDDALRATLVAAAALAQPQTHAGRSHLEYEHLASGGSLTCKANNGLVMRHGKRTGKQWFFRYRDDAGKERYQKLGTFPDMSVAAARTEAERLRDLRQRGEPLFNVQDAKPVTMEGLCERFIEEYALGSKPNGDPVKRSGREDARLLRRHIAPHYGGINALDFDAETLRPILSSLATTAPREAEKLRSVISTLFNVASGRTRKIAYNDGIWLPSGHSNPTTSATTPEHKATSFCPNQDELQAFVSKLDTARYGPTLKLQLLTMTRVGEAAQSEWSEIDLDNAVWTLPAARSKNKYGYRIQLSKQAVALLRVLKANQATKGIATDFLFPAPHNLSSPINKANAIRDAARVRKNSNLSDGFSTHALRHAGLTWLKEMLCPLEVRNAITNHRTKGQNEIVDGGYTGTANFDNHAKEWLQKWADHIDVLTGENIVEMPRRTQSFKQKA